jgi:hypothetical protein
MSVIWRDPPTAQGAPGVWLPVLEELKARPGSWAVIRSCNTVAKAYKHTANLRHARLTQIPHGYWEFSARKTEAGGDVYGRYLGATPEEAARITGLRGVKHLTAVRNGEVTW